MAEIDVNLNSLKLSASELKSVSDQLEQLSSQLEQIGSDLKLNCSDSREIANLIRRVSESTAKTANRDRKLSERLEDIVELYKSTESQILSNGNKVKSEFDKNKGNSGLLQKIKNLILSFLISIGIIPGGSSNGTSEYAGEPVDMCIGSYVSKVTELVLTGDIDLCFVRHYNSRFPQYSTLGIGWSHNYETSLTVDGEGLVLNSGDGRKEKFVGEDGKVFKSTFGSYDIIIKNDDGYTYHRKKSNDMLFNQIGQLTSICDKAGHCLVFDYDDGKLVRSSAGDSRWIEYSYNQDGLISEVKDSLGRCVVLNYIDDMLTEAISADGTAEQYEYDDESLLVSVINAEDVCFLTNTYDEQNRIVHQEFPDGTEMLYAYDEDGNITFTDRNKAVAVYFHDERLRHTCTRFEQGDEVYEYNDKNERISYTDLNGGVWQRTFDEKGNLLSITNPMGETIEYSYDPCSNLTGTVYPDGSKTSMKYDEQGNLIEVIDRAGGISRMSYENGRVSESIDADGVSVRYDYDNDGRVIAVTDANGNAEHYEYDNAGRVIRRTDKRGGEWNFEYDPMDRMTLVRNPLGEEKTYSYTPIGKPSVITDFDGLCESWIYNEMGLVVSHTDKAGNISEYIYDSMGNQSEVTLPDGQKVMKSYNHANLLEWSQVEGMEAYRYVYDKYGRLTDEFFGAEERHFCYDNVGRLISQTEKGRTVNVERDSMGRVIRRITPDGNEVVFSYDGMGRCVREEASSGRSASYEYTPAGRLLSRTDNAGVHADYKYNAKGKLERVEYSNGAYIDYKYDEADNLIERNHNRGYTEYFEYDKLNRRIAVKDSDGRSKQIRYDAAGNVIETVDATGASVKYEYSPVGKLTMVTDELGQTTRYAYDPRGRMTALLKGNYSEEVAESVLADPVIFQTPDNNEYHLTSWSFAPSGAISEVRNAVGSVDLYDYDGNGRMVRRTDMDGNTLNYRYTSGGLLEDVSTHFGPVANYRYDKMAQLCGMTDTLGESSFRFENGGRLTQVCDCFGNRIDYTLDQSGKTKAMLTDGIEYRYEYDDFGRLSSIFANDESVNYHYDNDGRLLRKEMPDGISEQYEYTAAGQLSKLVCTDTNGECYSCDYSYDIFGNVKEKHEVYRDDVEYTSVCEYDALHRLISFTENGVRKTYSYDEFGNCIETSENGNTIQYTYNVLNQLINKTCNGETIAEYSYDARGNMISSVENGKTIRYFYDCSNRMTRVESDDGDITEYLWDGMGNRIGKICNGKTISFVTDMSKPHHNVLAEKQGDLRRIFLWDGKLLGETGEDGKRWFFSDNLGSITGAVDGQGNFVESYRYDAFGNSTTNSFANSPGFGYTGLQYDSESELYFAKNRMYSPGLGRFVEKDKERYIYTVLPESVNLYAYCRNNPMTFIDPEGTDCYIFYLPEWENEAIADRRALADLYGYGIDQVHMIPLNNPSDLTNGWNGMGTVNGQPVDIDTVVINSHADHDSLYMGGYFDANDIRNLDNQNVRELVLYGCNAGHMDYPDSNPAAEFAQRVNGAQVFASDGTVYSDAGSRNPHPYDSRNDIHFRNQLIHGDRDNLGWIEYRYENGRVVTSVIGDKEMLLSDMTDEMRRRRGTLCPRS